LAGDALDLLATLPAESFDVVICDPPAFVKKKIDLQNGLRAYVKLNRDAMKLVRPGGLLVSASCSGHVKSADWNQVLLEAGQKAGRMFRSIHRGGHAPDHPVRPEFPEGEYLKCELGRIEYPY
jgi:23S rRNA (cytosine1962-C5)-methyltransferase